MIAALLAGASLAFPAQQGALAQPAKAPAAAKSSPVASAPAAAAAPAAAPAADSAQAGGNAEAGKAKLAMCIGCHGIAGYRTAYPDVYHVPKIYGQQQAYIVKALQAYKTGERSHPSMRGIARGLTDADMADLAAYYGGPHK
ncbi:MAG: cytochrome c [Betaproteobacteria bacterium]